MKRISILLLLVAFGGRSLAQNDTVTQRYIPTEANLQSREEFRDCGLGIFIHWGIYSMLANGEWVMERSRIPKAHYELLASGFYPSKFDAAQWVKAFKEAGAGYICITSRHHDGFSMFKTNEQNYNIVDGTPFGRDVLKELADECQKQGLRLHFYYSHVDWYREDYPLGNSGHHAGRELKPNWASYYQFMNNQLTELLTNYGPVGAIWFDGVWDHNGLNDIDWQLEEQYQLIHQLQPACLVGNNHHKTIVPGEDIQIFERDLPGENKAGYSAGQTVAQLPLESCITMNDHWGYDIKDANYKSTEEIIRTLIRAGGMNANLLLNIGPQPNGEIPQEALVRLKELGQWNARYGETLLGTRAGMIPPQDWGVVTQKERKIYIHITHLETDYLFLPLAGLKIKKAYRFDDGRVIKYKKAKDGLHLELGEVPTAVDYIVVLEQ